MYVLLCAVKVLLHFHSYLGLQWHSCIKQQQYSSGTVHFQYVILANVTVISVSQCLGFNCLVYHILNTAERNEAQRVISKNSKFMNIIHMTFVTVPFFNMALFR